MKISSLGLLSLHYNKYTHNSIVYSWVAKHRKMFSDRFLKIESVTR